MTDWIAGIDGCKHGWIAAVASPGDISTPEIRLVARLADLAEPPAAQHASAQGLIAVDMPIGLPERIVGSGRGPEQLVRPLLGGRQSSVFSIPARAAVQAETYPEACAAALATSDPPRKVSKQGFFLFPKIREIDAWLSSEPHWARRVHESHPEVVFQALNGGRPLDEPKKVGGRVWPAGMALRRALLAEAGIGAETLAMRAPRGAGEDDLLDALACLICARAIDAGAAQSFPDPPMRDAHGLAIAIWAPIPQKPITRRA
jgi:predicted RNase H-like nuclease